MFGNPAWRRKPFLTATKFLAFQLRRAVTFAPEIALPHAHGKITLKLPKNSSLAFVTAVYGAEDPDIALLERLLQPGDIFVDGGAHIGLFSLAASVKVGETGQVIAFEPAPETRKVLERHIEFNHCSNITVNPQALADTIGTRTFAAFSGEMWGYSSFAPPETNETANSVAVEVTTLDTVITDEIAPKIRLIKLDLEGAEYAALTGAKRLLMNDTPDLLLEIQAEHLERQGATIDQVTELLESYGYETYRPEWTPQNRLSLVRATLYEPDLLRPNFFATTRPERLRERGIILL